MQFGVHTGLQHTTTDELRALWRRIEDQRFDWISIWDHFYSAAVTAGPDGSIVAADADCLEAVVAHAALAAATTRVRCGSLVYCVCYRHPAVLANAMVAIDQLSGGRVTLGLGAGWHTQEAAAYGLPFPPRAGERLDQLEEAIQCIRGLLTEEVTDFKGKHFQLNAAQCEPKPVQARLPIWVGGGGERRTLPIAAAYADGWNLAFVPPETYAQKNAVLTQRCEAIGRDPATIDRSVNVTVAIGDDDLEARFGGAAEYIRRSTLTGTTQQMVDLVGNFADAGAGMLILAVRAPFDVEGLDRFAAEVMPEF